MITEAIATKIIGILVVVGFLTGLIYLWKLYDFLGVLRKKHQQVWAQLGSPTFWNNSPANAWRVSKFLQSRSYAGMTPDVARKGAIARYLMIGGLVYFAAVLCLAIVFSIAIHRG